MKKRIILFLALVLFFSLFSFPVGAEEKGKVSLTSEMKNPVRTMTFDTDLELNRNPGLVSLRITVRFDPKVLSLQSVRDAGLLPGYTVKENSQEGEVILQWKNSDETRDLVASGNLARFSFTVREDAPYGKSRVTAEISHRLFDAQNSRFESLSFDTVPLEVDLVCPHLNCTQEILEKASFDTAGKGKVICTDCGQEWENEVLPSLTSADGKLTGYVQPGQYKEEDQKSVRVDYLYGGAQARLCQTLFGDTLVRAFRITFTKNDSVFLPEGRSLVRLETDFELPQDFVLYAVKETTAEKIDCSQNGAFLDFDPAGGVFAIVSREVQLPTVLPPIHTLSTTTSPPSSTLSPGEAAKKKEMLYLGLGFAALVLCGSGAIVLMRKGKND